EVPRPRGGSLLPVKRIAVQVDKFGENLLPQQRPAASFAQEGPAFFSIPRREAALDEPDQVARRCGFQNHGVIARIQALRILPPETLLNSRGGEFRAI